jgi:hypothetical protein
MKVGVTGTALAIAAATLFLASHAQAQESGGSAGGAAQVKCVGGNDCKGKSACKTATNAGGPGQNSCKGQGMVMASSDDDCKAKQAAAKKE